MRQRSSGTNSGANAGHVSLYKFPADDKGFAGKVSASQSTDDVDVSVDSSVPVDADIFPSSVSPQRSLRQILPSARFQCGDDITLLTLAESSETAMPGDLVVYRIGQDDPTRIAAEALARGAAGILTEQVLPCPLPQCIVGDVEIAVASIEANLLQHPDQKLLTIGVAGSVGKTTTCLLLSTLFRARGIRVAFQTDLGSGDGVVQETSKESVAASSELVRWLAEAVDCESQVAIVELTDQHARHGNYQSVEFDVIVVTGSTLENKDFGPSSLSCVLDSLASDGVVVAPADDRRATRIISDAGVRNVTYGVRGEADITTKIIDQADGLTTLLMSYDNTTVAMETPLCGGAMAANHAAAATVGLLADMPLHQVVQDLSTLRQVPGRMQRVSRHGHASVLIDAAGDNDRCAAAMRAARASKGSGRLWCIAAIDDRKDAQSLARIGNLVERFADHAVITSLPSRKDRFMSAAHHVLDGVKEVAAMRLVASSERALQWAMAAAKPSDTILVLMNQKSDSANQERTRVCAIEKQLESFWDEAEQLATEASRPKSSGDQQQAKSHPNLKIFG